MALSSLFRIVLSTVSLRTRRSESTSSELTFFNSWPQHSSTGWQFSPKWPSWQELQWNPSKPLLQTHRPLLQCSVPMALHLSSSHIKVPTTAWTIKKQRYYLLKKHYYLPKREYMISRSWTIINPISVANVCCIYYKRVSLICIYLSSHSLQYWPKGPKSYSDYFSTYLFK